MKRLIICLMILSVGMIAGAQNLNLFAQQRLDYQLKVTTIKGLFNFLGIFGAYHGQARFSVDYNTAIKFQAFVVKDSVKNIFWFNNSAKINFERQKIKKIEYLLTDFTKQTWVVGNHDQKIYHYLDDKINDTLASGDNVPRDFICAVLHLINPNEIRFGQTHEVVFIATDSSKHAKWEQIKVIVGEQKKTIKISDNEIDCYEVTIITEDKINLGGGYTVGEPIIWVAINSGKPVKAKVKLYYGILPVAIVTGMIVVK